MVATVSCASAARALLRDDRLRVLATETIGTQLSAVALLDRHGTVLLHTRVRPIRSIPALADTPPLERVWPTLVALLTNRMVVGFQVTRDRRVLRQSARQLGATLMYTEWQRLSARSRSSAHVTPGRPSPGAFCLAGAALTEARTALAVLHALTVSPSYVPAPRRVFWRYL